MRAGLVSIYPPSRYVHIRHSGVASYSKNLVNSLLKYCSVVVFAEKISNSYDSYLERTTIHRCWTKGLRYPFQIFKTLLKNKVEVVHIQHETYLYGGLVSALVFPFLIFLVRLLKIPVIVTIHAVVPLSELNCFFLKENRIPGNPFIMRFGLALLIKLIVLLSTLVIVHEKKLKSTLIKEYKSPASKIEVIHHGVEELEVSIKPHDAKKKLGVNSKKVILFFGYITGYKNVGLLIDSAKFLKVNNWVMLIAGGIHPRLSADGTYLEYLSDLRKRASSISTSDILFKGFVPEEEISSYFSAADLVIFPYNTCISSSGPLSLTASYGKPFLVADSFRGIINSEDIMFANEPKKLAEKIDSFFADPAFRLKSLNWSRKFKMTRSWDEIAYKTALLYKKVVK